MESIRTKYSYDDISILARHSGQVGHIRHLERPDRAGKRAPIGVGILVVRVGALRRVILGGGYDAGDRLLETVAACLGTVVRAGDAFARLGDQDFVLLLADILNPAQLILAANKVLRTLQGHPALAAAANEFRIGIARAPEHGSGAEQLLLGAERAVALAEQRSTTVESYTAKLSSDTADGWVTAIRLAGAIERGELDLHYQRKIHLASGELAGLEALSRWKCADLGFVSPAVFIPIAERSNDIEKLTWSNLNAVLRQLGIWKTEGVDTCVAINVSAGCLRAADLSERVHRALGLWNVSPASLTLEVTESTAMSDCARSFAILAELRSLGVRVSIDDFGTGYSSFAYFRTLPADELKIDRSFIANLSSSAADRLVIRTIIDLAHNFNLRVVAEGIEDAETAKVLTDMQCDIGQGYYFARPVPATDVFRAAMPLSTAPVA